MKSLNLRTVLIVATTIALGIVAILGAWLLYQTRQKAVAPTAPRKAPAAETPTSQCTVTFSLAAASGSPTASPTASPTKTASPTASPTHTATASPTSSTSPTSSPGATSTAAPTSPPVGGGTSAPASTSTAKSTSLAKGGTTSASPALPVSGISWPGVAAAAGGIILLVFGILLAF